MAKLRPARCIREPKLPYTRISRYKRKSYVKTSIGTKIVQFVSGNVNKQFDAWVSVVASKTMVIRDNAIEAARVAANKYLSEHLTDEGFRLRVIPYPHYFIREHKLAAIAQADRYTRGMSLAFGKVTGRGVHIRVGSEIFRIEVNKNNLEYAKKAAELIEGKIGFTMIKLPDLKEGK